MNRSKFFRPLCFICVIAFTITCFLTPPLIFFRFSNQNTNQSLPELYIQLSPAIVVVTDEEGGGGSGFIVDKDKGLILTANHVIRKQVGLFADPNELDEPVVIKVVPFEGCSLSATIVDANAAVDLALIQVNPVGIEKLCSISFYDSTLKPGDSIFTIANPALYPRFISQGIICAQNFKIPDLWDDTFLMSISAIGAPGVSGSPIFSMQGKLVGMYVGVFARSYGVAIPIDIIKAYLDKNKVTLY